MSDPSNDSDKEGNNPHTPQTKNSKLQNPGSTQTSQGKSSQHQSKKEDKDKPRKRKIDTLGGYASRVMVGDKIQPICIPAGMSKVVVSRTQEKLPWGSYMIEATDNDNLPCGISVNHTYISPTKSRQVSVILLNTNTYNVWIHQPLYTTTIWDVELKDWEYEPIFTKDVSSNTVSPEDLHEDILSHSTETEQEGSETKQKETTGEKHEKPSFGAQPDTKSPRCRYRLSCSNGFRRYTRFWASWSSLGITNGNRSHNKPLELI